MRKLLRLIFVVCVWMALVCAGSAQEGGRKLVKKVTPVYPATARQFQVSGTVKLEVTVAADGAVKSTKVLGGHPMLTGAAVDAVKQWHYESGSESTETVSVTFSR